MWVTLFATMNSRSWKSKARSVDGLSYLRCELVANEEAVLDLDGPHEVVLKLLLELLRIGYANSPGEELFGPADDLLLRWLQR